MQHSVHAHSRPATIIGSCVLPVCLVSSGCGFGVNIAARHAAAIFVSACAANHHFSHIAVVTVMFCVFR